MEHFVSVQLDDVFQTGRACFEFWFIVECMIFHVAGVIAQLQRFFLR
jgi:hypothetical protein